MEYDSDACIIGFRRFKIRGPREHIPEHSLIGSWRDTIWPVGEPMVAKCKAYNRHTACNHGPLAQDDACKCGLHIFFSLSDAQNYTTTSGEGGYVIAIAAGGGRVLFDEKYARCEIADVICLIDPAEYGPHLVKKPGGETGDRTEDIRAWAEQAARRYGIPLLSLFDGMDLSEEFGSWVFGIEDLEEGGVCVEGVD